MTDMTDMAVNCIQQPAAAMLKAEMLTPYLLVLALVPTTTTGIVCDSSNKHPPCSCDDAEAKSCQPSSHLVHDDVVDGVLIVVLVVAQPHGEPLWIIPLKVLHTHTHTRTSL